MTQLQCMCESDAGSWTSPVDQNTGVEGLHISETCKAATRLLYQTLHGSAVAHGAIWLANVQVHPTTKQHQLLAQAFLTYAKKLFQ